MNTRRPNVYAISRSIWDDPDFANEAFTEREAWLWLVGAAAWKEVRVRGSGGTVTLARGEFSFSVRFLADKWGWSKDQVHRYMKKLKKRDMIQDVSRESNQVYFIKNYNRFQFGPQQDRDNNRDTIREDNSTRPRHDRDKEEKGKEGVEVRDTSSHRWDVSAAPAKPTPMPVPSEPERPPFILIPTNINGKDFGITEDDVADYECTFPAVDVRQELREMRRWSMDNPTKRKTARGMRQFIGKWLSKEQDRGHHNGASRPAHSGGKSANNSFGAALARCVNARAHGGIFARESEKPIEDVGARTSPIDRTGAVDVGKGADEGGVRREFA